MKSYKYEFSNSDVEALTNLLSMYLLFPTDKFVDNSAQQAINVACCESAIVKLQNTNNDFHPNELRIINMTLYMAILVIQGQVDVDSEIKNVCIKHIFSINKMYPIFNAVFEQFYT